MKFSEQHEWINVSQNIGTVGITDYAQHQLGDIVFAELPVIGKVVTKGDEAAVVESVKAASEIYTPVSGTVIEVNTNLQNNPDLINTDPHANGWIFKIQLSNMGEVDQLMDENTYKTFIGEH